MKNETVLIRKSDVIELLLQARHWGGALEWLDEQIEKVPVVYHVKHGCWENWGLAKEFTTYDSHKHYRGLNCSLCGRYGESRMKYCPWCGAVMDLEGEYSEKD